MVSSIRVARRPYLFRSRFFWNLYVTYALLVVATSAAIGLLVDRQMENALLTEVESSQRARVVLLSPSAHEIFLQAAHPGCSRAETEERMTKLGKEASV